MDCYQTDLKGVFVALAQATPDPMREGRMVLPAGCFFEPPPEYGHGQQARRAGDAWVIEDAPPKVVDRDGRPAGLLSLWDGQEITDTFVLMPILEEGWTATWTGAEWVIAATV